MAHPSPTLSLAGTTVNAIAIGTLAWGVAYPDPSKRPSDAACRALITEGLSLRDGTEEAATSIQVFDAADTYSPNPPGDEGYIETLLASELKSSERAMIVTKGGMRHGGPESRDWRPLHSSPDFSPSEVAVVARQSCKRISTLTGKPVFLYQLHHMDEKNLVPVIKELAKVQKEGLFLHLGVSNIKDVAQLELCLSAGVPICSVQNKYNIFLGETDRTRAEALLDFCEKNDITFMAYGVFGGLDARNAKVSLSTHDCPTLHDLAARKGCSVHTLFLAWLRHRWPRSCMPLVGGRTLEHLQQLRDATECSLHLQR